MKKYIPLFEEYSSGIGLAFKSLIRYIPPDLMEYIETLKNVDQDPGWHPEGNVYNHTEAVVNRLAKYNDPTLSIAGLLHDTGKDRTTFVSPKTGKLTSPGHENYSVELVDIFRDWIKEFGADPDGVRFIILNHMKIKFPNNLSDVEKRHIESSPYYDQLMKFSEADKGGVDESFEIYLTFFEINEEIVKRGGKWYVYSEKKSSAGKRKKLGGPYDNKSAAVKRLRQVEYFKAHK